MENPGSMQIFFYLITGYLLRIGEVCKEVQTTDFSSDNISIFEPANNHSNPASQAPCCQYPMIPKTAKNARFANPGIPGKTCKTPGSYRGIKWGGNGKTGPICIF